MAMKENSKKVLNYLKEVNGENVTAADVAVALGLEKRQVDGIFTSAIQRKGLGISMGKHIFVKEKNAENNTVTLSDEEFIFSRKIVLKNINLIPFDKIDSPIRVEAKIRYSQRVCPAVAEQTSEDEITLTFDTPQRAPSPGQAAVFYDGDTVLGGGTIVKGIK